MKKKKVLILLICLLVILFAGGGVYIYRNYYTDEGQEKQCVVNYIKDVNKGITVSKYEADDFMAELKIGTYKKYKITSIEKNREIKSMGGVGSYVVANTTYVDSISGESVEKQLAFLVLKKTGEPNYKVKLIAQNR